jgi:hypothetical protein
MIRRLNDSIGFLASLVSVIGFTTGVQNLPSMLGYKDPGIAPILAEKGYSGTAVFALTLTCVSLLMALHMLMVQFLVQLLAKSGFLVSSRGSIIKAGEGSKMRPISVMFFLLVAAFGFGLSTVVVDGIKSEYLQNGQTVLWVLGITSFLATLSATRVNGPEASRIQEGVVNVEYRGEYEVFYPIPYKTKPHLTLHGILGLRPLEQRPDGFRFEAEQGNSLLRVSWTADGVLDDSFESPTTRPKPAPKADAAD